MLDPSKRPGYLEIEAARKFAPEDPAWLSLTKDLLGLPEWMVPAVQRAVGNGSWRRANDPVMTVRQQAERQARRMGLSDQKPAAPKTE
jgi:hypothetical protein